MARDLGRGHVVVTILCDGGQKYLSRFYRREWLEERGLARFLPPSAGQLRIEP